MPRFVLLHHECPNDFPRASHWDLMFEANGALWTWAMSERPDSPRQQAERLGDHRIDYLDYEGPVSGGRGEVTRYDAGTFEIDPKETMPSDKLAVTLNGERLRGRMTLAREPASHFWRVEFSPD